jgi:UDP-glucose 4-epimerase
MATKKRILITGGMGYIGSHTYADLLENGHYEVVSADNLSNSPQIVADRIKAAAQNDGVQNFQIELQNAEETHNFFASQPTFDGVIHFAALKSVPDSVKNPIFYYQNNLNSLLNVLDCCEKFGVKNFIFSSSCSVYGNAKKLPVSEDTPFAPAESPYANTKQIGEEIIKNFCRHKPAVKCLALRYFNPVGAHKSGFLGEDPVNLPTNLVPIITQTAAGLRPMLQVFGGDYPTRDGTCLRDYIHVSDIAAAHRLAFEFSERQADGFYDFINLGTGEGVSVLELLKAFEKVSGEKLNYVIVPRREGDVVAVYSDTKKSTKLLQWRAERGVDEMMRSAWLWQKYLLKKSSES